MIGEIVGLSGSWSSGLATLLIKTKRGMQFIHCDNGATVRALDSAFPDFISEGHTFDNSAIEGKKIDFSTDFMGILEGFDVVEDD